MSENVEFCDSSGSEEMEEECVESEQQVNMGIVMEKVSSINREQQVLPEMGEQDLIGEDRFITIKRGTKRLRMNSKKSDELDLRNSKDNLVSNQYIVCVTANDVLPRQFGMAKLLKSQNIENITKLVYKNPYRVLIYFDTKASAIKMTNCEKIICDGKYKVALIGESPTCYGILRQVDLDIEDKEILTNLKCDFEIISAKRLKRQANDGKWVNSETIRLCFKSSTLPSHVYGFGCRFQVEKYTFPVSQCSVCWRYGHLSRVCPSNKIICPKCGNNHVNCETSVFKCVNCKGAHMAMNKKCPIFVKEKEIRRLMSENNCSYKEGLELYKDQGKNQYINTSNYVDMPTSEIYTLQSPQMECTQDTAPKKSYRDVVITEAIVHKEMSMSEDSGTEYSHISVNQNVTSQSVTPKKTKPKKKSKKTCQSQENLENVKFNTTQENDGQQKISDERREFLIKLYKKVKNVCLLDDNFSTKLRLIVKIIIQDCISWLMSWINKNEFATQLISFFSNG